MSGLLAAPARWFTPDAIPADLGPSAVAIGMFDGVHRGHQRLLARTRARADAAGVPAGAVTFTAHPLAHLAPERVPLALTDMRRKASLLHEYGMDFVVALPATAATFATTADEFADDLLAGRLGARAVVVGRDFRYGARAAGDTVTLAARLRDADVVVEPTVECGGERVSSTRIRAVIAAGRLDDAAALLGRPHRAGVRVERVHRDELSVRPTPGVSWPCAGLYRVRVTDVAGRTGLADLWRSPDRTVLDGWYGARPGDLLTVAF